MKSMFRYECKKVIGQAFFWKFIYSIFIINIIIIGLSIYSSQQNQGYYQDQFMSEMIADELHHKDEIDGFQSTLLNRIEESKKLQDSSLFQKLEGFDERYLDLKIDKLSQLTNIGIIYQDVRGADLLFQNESTYLLFLSICIIVGYFVFTQDEEQGTLAYIRTMKYDAKVMVQKLISAILISLVCGLFLFLSNYIIGVFVYGNWDWNLSILQLKGMIDSVHHMSLYQYGLYFILCFILFIIFIQVFISCLSYLSKNAFIVIGIVGAIFMIEILLYHNISDDSYLVCLKEWNLWMFLLNIPLFQNFRTVKMLNHCDLYIAITIFIVIVIVGLYFLSYYTFKNGKTMISIKLPILKNSHIYSLGIYEGYKIFWKQGVLILMIMYGWFTLYNMSGFKPFIDTNTYYYRTYAKQIESLNDEKKEEYVMQQNDNYEDLHRQLNDLNMMQQQGEISDAKFEIEVYPIKKALYSEPGWQQAYKQYLWTKDNDKVFVEEYGYQYLLEHLKVDGILWLGLSWFVLAIALHNVMAIENKGDVKVLLELSKYKTKRINLWKYLYSILITIFAYVFGLGLYLMFVSNYFDLSMFQAPLSSLSFLNMDGKLSIGMFLILVIAISFILTLLYTFVCLLFSKKCKTSGQSLISCLILACVTLVCLIITLV